MRFSSHGAAVLALALSNSCYALEATVLGNTAVDKTILTDTALKAVILADTNRDGKVDTEGDTDSDNKSEWTEERGAFFMANIGDTDRRCSKKLGSWEDVPEVYESSLDECNDASGNVQRNPKYLAPLRTLPIVRLSASATGSISVTDEWAANYTRVFVKEGSEWTYVSANRTFAAEELKRGLELGVDAREIRRPRVWDGIAHVHFTISDGDVMANDSVALRVAPVLTHHHAQLTERVFSSLAPNHTGQAEFVAELQRNVADAGILEPVFLFDTGDIWAQDFFEPGYTSIPGPDGPVVLRIMIRSAQDYRTTAREIFRLLRNENVGAVQQPGDGNSLESTGNLETIPPYTHNGKSYPAGRVVIGEWEEKRPFMFEFFRAQEVQEPIALDTIWLHVGHVDEFIQFLPADNERGWVVMADDPLAGVALLKKAVADGHGQKKALSRPAFPSDDPEICLPGETISEVLEIRDFEEVNKLAADRIAANLATLRRETGVTNDEIFRVPAMFYYTDAEGWTCGDDATNTTTAGKPGAKSPKSFTKKSFIGGPRSKAKSITEAAQPPNLHPSLNTGLKRREVNTTDYLSAFYPGTINGVVLTDSLVLAPNPWGPLINGVDILAKAVTDVYAKVGFNITFQDDWFPLHLEEGEIHCGTNTWRNADKKWW
ncbi:hypothetical protein FZEAL_3902 [Fusarium zealandicum]|uniref:Protein-arginine deiminase C-terminal domain-containing protein n=1 Tax=Fusarium zealandicum TaxID=1053134 RepID=A0A8H4UNG1_9HYPO|nr:hypothetical protein FZEAL_3902 [Fusarium zealandicum]